MFSRIFQHFRAYLKSQKRIYADYATLTPISERVLSRMNEIYTRYGQNPSALYASAVTAKKLLEKARKDVAQLLSGASLHSVHADEIYFTSGGTEGNNIVIQGVVDAWYEQSNKEGETLPHVVISSIEHPAVRKVVEELVRKKRITASYVPVTEKGIVDMVALKQVFQTEKDIILVSIMLVNNEIGTIQPLKDIAKLVRQYRKNNTSVYPYFHTDACQAPCYIDMTIDTYGIDMMTLDGGKVYGPRGVGCVYVKRHVTIVSTQQGGGQESGLRPGTENLPAIVGFAIALDDAYAMRKKEVVRLKAMQAYMYKHIGGDVYINGSTHDEDRIVNNINICIPGSDSEFVVFQMDVAGVEVSAVTACQNSQEESRSFVVDALGQACGGSSIRISLGRYTTWRDVKKIVSVVNEVSRV